MSAHRVKRVESVSRLVKRIQFKQRVLSRACVRLNQLIADEYGSGGSSEAQEAAFNAVSRASHNLELHCMRAIGSPPDVDVENTMVDLLDEIDWSDDTVTGSRYEFDDPQIDYVTKNRYIFAAIIALVKRAHAAPSR